MASRQQAAGSGQSRRAGIGSKWGLGIGDWGLAIISRERKPTVPHPAGCHWRLASTLQESPCTSVSSVVKKHRLRKGTVPFSLRENRDSPRGFTLIDLLVSVTIIGILAAITLAAVGAVRQRARTDKTRNLITKLHYIVMNKYDSYRTRRLPISILPGTRPYEAARQRVNAVRDLMRMEMPDRWSDVWNDPLPLSPQISRPALSQRYLRIYQRAWNAADGDPEKQGRVGTNAAAECLYMIVMAIPEAADQFHESEIADVDNDGLPEFVDAWGNPIRFIRWPAGFYWDPADNYYGQSDLQPGPATFEDGSTNPKFQPDPFDPRKAMTIATGIDQYILFPLIYSAGPDEEYDINRGTNSSGGTHAYGLVGPNLPTIQEDDNSPRLLVGRPVDNDADPTKPDTWFDDLRHYDNIHNHRLETGRGK